jgi:hypothetical protein
MAIELESYSVEEKVDIPFWKWRELWISPIILFLIIGYIAFAITFLFVWLIKWILFSPIRPFTKSVWLCEQGFHRYRKDRCAHVGPYFYKHITKCNVCGKEKAEYSQYKD